MQQHTIVKSNGLVKGCCTPNNMTQVSDPRPGIIVNVCKTCGCRHIEMMVEPKHFNMSGRGL